MTITTDLTIKLFFYNDNHRPCPIAYHDHEVYGKLAVNLPNNPMEPNEFALKTYSENLGWAKKLIHSHPDKFQATRRNVNTGYAYCPIYRLTPEYIAFEFERTYNPLTDIYEADPPLFDLYKKYCEK